MVVVQHGAGEAPPEHAHPPLLSCMVLASKKNFMLRLPSAIVLSF